MYIANDYGNTVMHYAFFYRLDEYIMKLHSIDSKMMYVPNIKNKKPIDFADSVFLKEIGIGK